ncbi:hypothetical protein BGW38_005512 [Lunasporangiospora selenospora]|uniref:Uncharacterized protein n=1 Tax=Lunasporangiospora selenospora TaxID=979761 RepID=A0A9P6KBF1_9FUNG|nr:hypothetical protein BGW38_005512 [Lunasporangiospora selenospora]
MRFSPSFLLGTLAFVLTITPSAVQACERECQVNVSHAFADKYEVLSRNYYTTISTKIDSSLLYGVPEGTLTAQEQASAKQAITTAVSQASDAWSTSIFRTVFDSIFKDEPKFKGDCNNPKRVIQPPRGVWWKMTDCNEMDYICGNPPSICHFMPMIKSRTTQKLSYQLQTLLDGNDADVYSNYVGPALIQMMADQPKLAPFQATMHGNLNEILENVKAELKDFANDHQWEPSWDLEIKKLLLTFP